MINENGNPQYKYYYGNPEPIAMSMERVYDRSSSWAIGTGSENDTGPADESDARTEL